MSRVVLPTLSDIDVITDAIDDTVGAHASLSTIVATSLRYQAYP